MMNVFSVPRGTRDILPEEIQLWQKIELTARKILNLYNYLEIRTPIFEEADLFARSVGQATDIVEKQMLNLKSQKETDSISGLALRPEGTAAIARSYIENGLDKKERLSKFFYIGPMFRGERPQKGRLRQFHQIGAEAIGPCSCSPYLDAEMIALSGQILKQVGIRNFKLNINTLGDLKDKDRFAALLRGRLGENISDFCADCQGRFQRNVFRILDCKNRACRSIVDEIQINYDFLSKQSLEYYSQVKIILNELGVDFSENPKLVRGLDYYTHTVFEFSAPGLGSQDALGAGGRYSHLVEQLGGPRVDAIGFALGIERILMAMPKDAVGPSKTLDVYVIALDEAAVKIGFQVTSSLRQRGVSCDFAFYSSSLKSQLRQANKWGARFVIIIGENELRKGVVAIKNMISGQQDEIGIREVSQYRF